MREIALVADLHGNWPATEAVALDIERRGIREIYCLGDMLGKGPSGASTLAWAMESCQVVLAGNWDLHIVGRKNSPDLDFYRRQLGSRQMEAVRRLPMECELFFVGRSVRLIHGRPLTRDLLTPEAPEAEWAPYFAAARGSYEVIGYADIHRQALRTLSANRLIFNTGSVGNSIGDTRAHYATIREGDEGELRIEFMSLLYDRERAMRDARATPDLPNLESYLREIETGIYSR